MRITRQFLPVLLLVLGLYSLTGCGGGSASSLAHSLNQPGSSIDGVTSGSFKAVRYNDHGYQDSSLNPTMVLATTDNGATTTVTIAVHDSSAMFGAAIDLFYDAASYSPVQTQFAGLVTTPLELASTKTTGIVSLGQADVNGVSVRNGQFATITFMNGPSRTVSAAGDAHNAPVNYVYPKSPATGVTVNTKGFEVTSASADAGDATYAIRATWAIADGDSNGTSNVSDLTALAFNGFLFAAHAVTNTTNFGCAASDYDGNCETNAADITSLAQHLNEATAGIDVFIADDGHTFDGTETVLKHWNWSDGADRGTLATIASLNEAFRSWSGTVTKAEAIAADTDGDGKVILSARTTGTGAPGPIFTDDTVAVTYTPGPPPPPAGVVVTDFNVQIVNSGAPLDFTGTGGDAPLQAGDAGVVLNVTGVSGTYDDGLGGAPVAFTAASGIGGAHEISQTDYDATLLSIQGSVNWQVTTQGDTTMGEYHSATDVLALSATTGTGVTGVVTVDSDPHSTLATTPEGRLRATVTAAGASIPNDITYDYKLDVTEDPAAPVFDQLGSLAPPEGNYLGVNAVGSTSIGVHVTLGTQGLPADRSLMQVKLVDLTDPSGSSNLTYLASGQLADGQFRYDENQKLLNVQIAGVTVANHLYGLHFILPAGAGTTTSSVDCADSALGALKFLKVGPPPAPVAFSTLPAKDEITGANKVLDIMYPDPVIRRDPRMRFQGNTAVYSDSAGFNDIIKQDGGEFAPANINVTGQGNKIFPLVIAIQGTDPTTITSSTTSDPLVNAVYVTPAGIILNIAGVTNGASDASYAFKLFSGAANVAQWSDLGTGTFNYHAQGIAPSGFDAVDFGVNVFDDVSRGQRTLANADWTKKDLNGDTIKTAVPDVLYINFYGYKLLEFDNTNPYWTDTATPDVHSNQNTILRITHDDQPGHGTPRDVPLVPRTAALDVQGHMLATFVPTKEYWQKAGTPGWYGDLLPGEKYFLTIVDQQDANNNVEFATELTTSGSNPNF